jgi:pSer/pThr/pTyr-binding forkhead associated (FHA) protein
MDWEIGPQPTNGGAVGRARAWLVSLDGTELGEFPLVGDEIRIGSATDNHRVISGDTVSRHHAVLVRTGDEYRVTDLGSTNGTYVNGRKVTDTAELRRGDEIRFGSARFVLQGYSGTAPQLSRAISKPVLVAIIGIGFVFSFGLVEFLLNFGRLEQAAVATASPASTSSARSPTSVPSAAASISLEKPEKAGSETPLTPEVQAWLGPLNHYRAIARLPPVAADAKLSRGDYLHSLYLVKNYGEDIRKGVNLGARMHTEEAGNRWYTAEGLAAASAGDVDEIWDPRGTPSPSWAIDNWMQVPFHRMTILNPDLHRVGYGSYCEGDVCVASLNVLSDADRLPSKPQPLAMPIQYPPDRSAMRGWSFSGEWPDPLTSCPGYTAHAGLPITLQLGPLVTPAISGYALTSNGVPVEVCVFDANTYRNPDAFAQTRGRDGLGDFGGVVLIPRAPLPPGTYEVSVTTAVRTYPWSFSITP